MEKNFYFGGQSDLYLDPVRAMAPEYLKIHLDTVTYRKAMLSHYENSCLAEDTFGHRDL